MTMTLKAKISASLFFLFGIILLLGGLSAFYLNRLSGDAQAILKDNYISLEFASNMLKALENPTNPDALSDFEANLKKQEANITEVGEGAATNNLRRAFNRLRAGRTDSLTIGQIRQSLFALDDLNRQAIVRKSEVAKETANDALVWLAVIGTTCFLIVFSFIINIPSYIANPLRELTRGIRQVASRNFEERLHFRSSDEFGELAQSFNSMAQKLDEYEHSNLARVLFEKKRIETLVQLMTDGIVGLDENRRILFVNPVAGRLLGLPQEQLIGQYAPDVATTNDLMRTLIQEIMPFDGATARPNPATAGQAVPDGDAAPALLKIYDPGLDGPGKESYFTRWVQPVAVVRTGESQPVQAGYVIVLQNITSYKELDQAKTNFIATVSHELKTPISAIKLSLKLLHDNRVGGLNDEQKQLVDSVDDQANRLLSITGELLNMAQVESGQIQLQMRPVRAAELVEVATDALRVQADQKNVRFVVNIAETLPPVLADSDKASWVLINFLSNAVRHSPADAAIDLTVQPATTTTGKAAVEFNVRDYGPGLRPEHRNRVFDRYFRAPGLNGQPSGTGLGLAISKEFIVSMQGEIGLHDEVAPGAAFYFRLLNVG